MDCILDNVTHDPILHHREPGDHFEEFAVAIRRELAPGSVLEKLLAERVILSAWSLRAVAEEELTAIRSSHYCESSEESFEPCPASRERDRVDVSPQGIFLVTHCLEKSLDLFRRLRAEGASPASRPEVAPATVTNGASFDADSDSDTDSDSVFDIDIDFDFDADFGFGDPADFSNEWPVYPSQGGIENDRDEDDTTEMAGRREEKLAERWQDRLVLDLNVSEHSPVIKGTWVTVNHVVSLIVDGWTWSDILRTHPELTEDDIRTCLAYTVAQDDGEL